MSEANHYDDDKLKWHLLPLDVVRMVVRVLQHGAETKYDEFNWKKGIHYSRLYNSAMRHIDAWWSGTNYDISTGHHHLAHAITNLIFILWFIRRADRNVGDEFLDDRPDRNWYEQELDDRTEI